MNEQANSAVFIHMRNGVVETAIMYGRYETLSDEAIRKYRREGKMLFDRNVETKDGHERFTLYDYFHE